MNRYRIFETVPKNKAKEGKGSRVVDRIVKTLKNMDSVAVKVRMSPLPSPIQALSHSVVLPENLPKTGIYYEITWLEPKLKRKAPWQALAERSQSNV